MSDFEYFKNTYGGGYPGFKLNQNQDKNQNQYQKRFELNHGTNIPNIKGQTQTNDVFLKKLLLTVADNNKQVNVHFNSVSSGQPLLNLSGESVIRNVKGFENQVLTLLVASFNLQRLQAKYALDTKIGITGPNVNKYENLNSKIDNLITSIKSNKIVNKAGSIYNKTIGYEKSDFYDPINMFAKYGGGIAVGVGAASLLYKIGTIIPKYLNPALTKGLTKLIDANTAQSLHTAQSLLPAVKLVGDLSSMLPILLTVSNFVSKRVKKYGKIDTERALEFEKNVKAKGNIFSDILSGKALFDLENRRTKGEFKATLGQRFAQAAIDLIGSSAKTAQLNTERVTYLRRVDREVSKVGIKPDMMKLITTPSAKLVTNIDTYEGKMVSLTSGVYDSLRFALLELVSIRSGIIGSKNKDVADSNTLLSFLNRIDNEKAKREDRNITNKTALGKNILKAGALGTLLGLPFGIIPAMGSTGMILGGTGAMAGYLGLKTAHSAFRRTVSTKGRSVLKGAGVAGGSYLAATNPLLNQLGVLGLNSLGGSALTSGVLGAGLPGLLTGLLIAGLVGSGGKYLFNKLKSRKELKFNQREEEIEKSQERKYLATLKLSTGISYSTAKLLTTPSRLVLGQLKNKDPHTQQMMLWGNIYDLMRNMATNINIVRQGTVGDFKQGENLLEFFEKSEKEKSEREDKHKGGIFGWKNKLKDFKPNLKHGALLSSIPIIMSLISGAGVLSPELAMAAVGGSLLSPIFKLGKKLYTDRRNKKEEEKLEKERLRNKAIEEFQRKIDEFTGKNKSDQKLANIALTSALPKIAEEQRLLLSKIYEVESNIYEVSSKLYVALTKDKDLKYRTHNISKKVYNINTGEYQSEKEYKETRNSALNELKNGLMQDIEREFIKSLNFRDIFLNEIQFKNKKNAFFDRYSDIPFRQNYENAIRGSKEESFRLNFKNPQAMQLPQKLNLDSKSFPNYTEILNTISEDIKAGLLSDKRKPLIREISASNDDEYCPDCLKELSKKLLEISEASKKPAIAAYSGGIYNFSPKGQDTVPVGLEVGSAVIPREAVKRFSVAKKLGRVIHAQSGSYGVVPHGYVGAMVAPGEVVVPKEVVSANRPLVNGLVNAGRMIQKGKRLYSGGVINPNYYASGNADDEGFIFDKLKSLLKTGKNLLDKSIFSNLYDLNPVFALDLQHKNEGGYVNPRYYITGTDSVDSIYSLLGEKGDIVQNKYFDKIKNEKFKELSISLFKSPKFLKFIKDSSKETGARTSGSLIIEALSGIPFANILAKLAYDGYKIFDIVKNDKDRIKEVFSDIFLNPSNYAEYGGLLTGSATGIPMMGIAARLGTDIIKSKFKKAGALVTGGTIYPEYYSIGNEELKDHYGNMAVGYYGDGTNYIDIGKNKLSNLINVGRDNLSNLFNIGKDKLSGFGNNLANSILPGLTNNLVSPIATALSNLFIKVIKDMPNSAITKGLLITALGPVSIITELFFTAKEAISEYSKEYIKSGSILKSISSSIFSIFDTSGSGFINAFNKGTKYGAIGALIASAIPVPGANWVIGYILGAGVGGLLGWIEDGRLTEISRASLRKLDDIVMEPVNKFVDWFKDTFVSPIYEFIMKIKRWVNTKIGWIEPETATSQPQVKKSWLKYEGGLISSPKYYQQGKIDTTPNIQTEEERQDSRKEQIQEKQEEIQTTSLVSISSNIKDLYNLMKDKLKPPPKDKETPKDKEKVEPGFLSKLIGLGLAGYAIWKLAGPYIKEIGKTIYSKFDEYIIQPVSNFFSWFDENVFEPLKGMFGSITNYITDKLRIIGIDFSSDEQKQLRQEIQTTSGNKLDLKSLKDRSAAANIEINKELERRYENITGVSNLEDIKKAFIEGKSIYKSDLEALGVFSPQEINDLIQKKAKYLVDTETQKGVTGWLFKKTPEQRIQEKQQYDENQEKLRRSQLIKQNLLIDETETKYSGGVISPKYYIEGTPEVKYIKEKSEKLLNDILSIKDEKKRQELYDSFTNTESYKLLSLKSKQIFDDLVKLKSTLSKDDIIYLKDEFVKNYSSVTDNINSLLLDYIDKHPNVTTQFKELRESLINSATAGLTFTIESVNEQLETLSSNNPEAKKQIQELRSKIVESTSGGMNISAEFLNKQLEDLKLAYPGLKNQLQDLQVNLVKSVSGTMKSVSTGISDLLNSNELGFKGFIEDIFKNGLNSEYTDPMNVKKSFQKNLFENPAGKMVFNTIDRATRIGNNSDEWPPGSEGWTERTFKRNKSMFDDRITNVVGVVKNSKGEILKIKEIKKGPWIDVFWDEKNGKYERNRQVSNQLPDFSISDKFLNKDYLPKTSELPKVNSDFVGPPMKFGPDVNSESKLPESGVNVPNLASGGIINTQSKEDMKKFFIEVISESKIQFNDKFNKMFKDIYDKILNKSNVTSTDKDEKSNSDTNIQIQDSNKNQNQNQFSSSLNDYNSIDFGKIANSFSNMMNPGIMIGRSPISEYSGGIIFPNYFAEGGVVNAPTTNSISPYGSSIDLDELSKYINYTASTPYKEGIGGLAENTQKKFFQLAKEFYNQTGKKLRVTSAYRSAQLQAKLKGNTSNTKLVGSAGRSQHNHGYALDIDYRGKDPTTWNSSPQGKYINDSGLAEKYGFAIGPNTLAREAWHMEDTDSLTRKDKSAMQKAMELSLSGKTGYEIDKILRGGSSQYNTTGFNTSDNINIPGYQQFTPGSSTQQSSFIGSEAGSTSSSPNIPDIAGQIGNMQSSLSSIFGGGQVSAGGASATFRTPNIPGVDISSIGTGTPSSFGSTSPIGTTSSINATSPTGTTSSINATSPTGTSNATSPTGTSSGGVNFGGGSFNQKAPGIMKQLMSDFGLNEIQAAAILGNLGHESGGFKYAQELNPRSGRGGYGWAQWTGSRRKAFESWASQNGLNINSDAANYGFLKHELQTTHKNAISALKQTNSLDAGVQAFERVFERAGVKHYESRNKYANSALESYKAGGGQVSPSSGMSSGSDVASMGSGGGGSGAQTESGSTSSSPSMPDIAGQINSMQSSLSNAFGGGQVSVGGASATFRTPNVPGATQSPTPAVSQITPPSLETSQSEEDIKVPEASSPGISHEPQKTQLQPEYNVKPSSDPQVLSSGVHTSVDPVSNNIFMWLCDLTGRSLMFGALSQATGQMPFPVVDGSRII